jgi:hypothetical protein
LIIESIVAVGFRQRIGDKRHFIGGTICKDVLNKACGIGHMWFEGTYLPSRAQVSGGKYGIHANIRANVIKHIIGPQVPLDPINRAWFFLKETLGPVLLLVIVITKMVRVGAVEDCGYAGGGLREALFPGCWGDPTLMAFKSTFESVQQHVRSSFD